MDNHHETVKRTFYRQSAWKHIETGDVVIYYGTETPIQDGSYKKIYCQDVSQVTITIPVLDESKPHSFASLSVELPKLVEVAPDAPAPVQSEVESAPKA